MSSFQRRIVLSGVLVVVAIIGLFIGLNAANQTPPTAQSLSYKMTLDPTIIANLTSIPQTTPLSDEDAKPYLDFEARVNACEDYSEERRSQMLQHIAWLVDPASIPPDMLIAFGNQPDGALIFGMASFTSIQWRLLDRPAESCLVDIGRDLNKLLVAFERDPLTIYDE